MDLQSSVSVSHVDSLASINEWKHEHGVKIIGFPSLRDRDAHLSVVKVIGPCDSVLMSSDEWYSPAVVWLQLFLPEDATVI